MHNTGEAIVGAYLQHIRGCEFVQYNLHTPDVQGEIDVIGINIRERTLYVCEVAIHLITGLQYVKERRPDNVDRLLKKFEKDIEYANKYFSDFTRVFMLWSPIVKNQRDGAKDNQLHDVEEIERRLAQSHGVQLQLVINERFAGYLADLRAYAQNETKELKSPVLRLMQIEEKLKLHLAKRCT
jgi:Holliday junction resolvase-like predicted endonuclease